MIPTITHTKHHLPPSESSAPKRQKIDSSHSTAPHHYTPLDNFLLKMGLDITTLILSYLKIEQLAGFATTLNSSDPLLQSYLNREICSAENRIPLRRCISGYATERTFIHSPVVLSQLRDQTVLSNDKAEYFAEIGFPLEIFWTTGRSVKYLTWDPDYSPKPTTETLVRAQRAAAFIIGASQHCPNIKSIHIQRCIKHPLAVKAFVESISNWPLLQDLGLGINNFELLNSTSTQKIKSLRLYDNSFEEYSSDDLFLQIGKKFPILSSLELSYIDFSRCPFKLAPNCSTLESLSIEFTHYLPSRCTPAPDDVCALIAKCPIRTLKLAFFSPSIFEALLTYERRLEKAAFVIEGSEMTPDLLNTFFESNRASLRSFKNPGDILSDEFFSVLLKFVSDNQTLKALDVGFGPTISLENLNTFMKKCSHIPWVCIRLYNFEGSVEYLQLAKKTYPNIIFLNI